MVNFVPGVINIIPNLIFRYFVESPSDFGYLIKADDDVFVAMPELIKMINEEGKLSGI